MKIYSLGDWKVYFNTDTKQIETIFLNRREVNEIPSFVVNVFYMMIKEDNLI
jgi:hypothetical protein